MYNDTFVSYFIPTANSNPRCDTSCLGPTPPICNSVSGCLPGRAGKLWGRQKSRQEQVEHDRVGCRSLGVPLPQRRVATWQTVELLWRGGEQRGLPGENVCAGIRAPTDQFYFTSSDPAVLQAEGGGGGKLSVGALQFCPISPRASPCN